MVSSVIKCYQVLPVLSSVVTFFSVVIICYHVVSSVIKCYKMLSTGIICCQVL